MKKVAILLTLFLWGLKVPGQINKYGVPLIKNYSAEVIHGSDYTHSIIKDNLGNVYLANEDMGIIRYDGNNWRTIPVRNNQLIRALGKDRQGVIYAGGRYEFGYLVPDTYGKMTYVSLSQRLEESNVNRNTSSDTGKVDSNKQKISIGQILSLVVKDSHVYFVSDEALFDYNIINDSLTYINFKSINLSYVLKVFLIDQKVIVGDNSKGLFEYKDGKMELIPGGDFFSQKRCMVVMPYDKNRALVATFEFGLYLLDYVTGEVTKDFVQPSLQKMLVESRIYSGISLPSGELAFGTIQGGVFILDHEGRLVNYWDKDNSGLMDNGVLAFYCDSSKNSELWISTIRFISKVYINLPFTEFSPKSGIDGGVNSICEMDGNIYVSTDLGVYKSRTNEKGHREYTKIPEIIDQVFPICHAKVGNEDFVLAGSISGIFQITRTGKVFKISGDLLDKSEKDRKMDINVRVIVQSKINPSRFYVGCNVEGIKVFEYNSGKWKTIRTYKIGQGSAVGIVEADNGDLLFGTDFSNNLFHVAFKDSVPVLYGADKGIPEATIYSIAWINNKIVLATGDGLFLHLKDTDSWIPFNEVTGGYSTGKQSLMVMQDNDNDFWVATKEKRYSEILFKNTDGKINSYFGPLALLPNVRMLDIKSIDNRIWMAKSNSIYVIEKEKLLAEIPEISPFLNKIIVGRDSIIMDESFVKKGEWERNIPSATRQGLKIPELKFNLNSVSFYWSTPYFVNEESTVYRFKLEGFDSDWSGWEKVYYKDYTNLPFGHYYFKVKAQTATDIITNETVYEFIILKPWYLTTVMIVLYAIILIFIILAIIKAYTKKLKNENIRLEGIVAERTAVVVKQKEELESSIHYASRIQMALLPSEAILSENIKNYFVLFKPRDIVSGDFYWMTKKDERLYIVAADCTGHGVPGAFMSLLGMSFLDEIIDKETAPRADVILRELRLHVTESLKQVGGDDEAKDGMDMALLVIDFNSKRIEFSGAYNPCFRIRKLTEAETEIYKDNTVEMPDGSMSNGKYLLETIYASKMPIGISSRMNEDFVFHHWALDKGVSYYLFSDGYIDQFGGPNGRKFMKKRFKRLLLDIQDYPMNKQKEILENNLNDWIGHSPQIDDILVMGIRTD
jgi:serine phosphatase RsbU (regulator of sigma subunit)/ligand-binding sensor domain-containing protein